MITRVVKGLAKCITTGNPQPKQDLTRIYQAMVGQNLQQLPPQQRAPLLPIQNNRPIEEGRNPQEPETIDRDPTPPSSARSAREDHGRKEEHLLNSDSVIHEINDQFAPALSHKDPMPVTIHDGQIPRKIRQEDSQVINNENGLEEFSTVSIDELQTENLPINTTQRKPKPKPTWNSSPKVDTPRHIRTNR